MSIFITLLLVSTLLSLSGIGWAFSLLDIEFRLAGLLGIAGLAGIILRNSILYFRYRRKADHQADSGYYPARLLHTLTLAGSVGVFALTLNMSPLWNPQGMCNSLIMLLIMLLLIVLLPLRNTFIHQKIIHDQISIVRLKQLTTIITGLFFVTLLFSVFTCYMNH